MIRVLLVIAAAAYALRNVIALAEGRPPTEIEPMLLATVLMKLYAKEE